MPLVGRYNELAAETMWRCEGSGGDARGAPAWVIHEVETRPVEPFALARAGDAPQRLLIGFGRAHSSTHASMDWISEVIRHSAALRKLSLFDTDLHVGRPKCPGFPHQFLNAWSRSRRACCWTVTEPLPSQSNSLRASVCSAACEV